MMPSEKRSQPRVTVRRDDKQRATVVSSGLSLFKQVHLRWASTLLSRSIGTRTEWMPGLTRVPSSKAQRPTANHEAHQHHGEAPQTRWAGSSCPQLAQELSRGRDAGHDRRRPQQMGSALGAMKPPNSESVGAQPGVSGRLQGPRAGAVGRAPALGRSCTSPPVTASRERVSSFNCMSSFRSSTTVPAALS